jgi:hypothetical protein
MRIKSVPRVIAFTNLGLPGLYGGEPHGLCACFGHTDFSNLVIAQPVAVALDIDHLAVMQQPVLVVTSSGAAVIIRNVRHPAYLSIR